MHKKKQGRKNEIINKQPGNDMAEQARSKQKEEAVRS
jgi:hypothetical protein